MTNLPNIPVPIDQESGKGQKPEPEILGPETGLGAIGGGEDPLVRAVRLAPFQARSEFAERAVNAGIVEHYARESERAQAEIRDLRRRIESLQETSATLREEKSDLNARLEGLEKPWAERMRQIVGGGLMGIAFKVWDWNGGVASFIFILGFCLVVVPMFVTPRGK